MNKKLIIGGAAALVVVGLVVWMLIPAKAPPPKKVEAPTGPDPALLAKVAELVKKAEDLEAKGKFGEALSTLKELAALKPDEPRLAALKPRIEEKYRKLEAWTSAHKRAEAGKAEALDKDTAAAWQRVIDACAEAAKHAPMEEQRRLTKDLVAFAEQRRDWASARDEDKKGNLAAALDLVGKAMAAREAPPELAAFKASLEKRKRKIEFEKAASVARAEQAPARAIELWRAARALADEAKDVEEAERRISVLLPKVDPAVREQRYEAAMKAGEEALAAGKVEEAEKAFKEAQALKGVEPRSAQALQRVEVVKKAKGYDLAMAEAKDLEGKKEWGKAIEAYDRALRIRSGDKAATERRRTVEADFWPPRIVLLLDEGQGAKMEFVRVKAATFVMGDERGEPDEKPREVTLGRDYWIQTTEVTQRQWKAVLKSEPWGFKGLPDLPVEGVTWADAKAFLAKLNEEFEEALKGRKAFLPTEAEWEHACRAGTKTRYSFGDDEGALGEHAWFTSNTKRSTEAAGRKRPNAWGLFDLHGNVAEWCEDLYAFDPSKPPAAPKEDEPEFRSIRGGSWNDRAVNCRTANREKALAIRTSLFVGFRAVLR
jgi:formylglycine-generating enzyme required for sulfatase activity